MTTPPTLISLFKEQLENESAKIAASRSLNERGDFLIWWYFLKLMGLDATEIEEIVCDGPNDLGIDAIWITEDGFVHFYQFKNPGATESGFPGGEVDKVLAGLNLILSRKHESIANPALRGQVEEIYQNVPAGYRLHLVTSGAGISGESRAKLDAFVSQLNGPSESFFTWQVEDIKALQDAFYQKNLPTVETPIVLELSQTPYPVRSADHDCYMFHTTGTVLATLYDTHGEQLLQQNIRVYQGDRATNAAIRKTCAGADSGNFFHFNNGVTFLCESAGWDAFTRRLTLERAQVVNGGQTIRVLSGVLKAGELRGDVVVPVRVITSQGDKEFGSNVAVNLNNQNRIEPSFLRSNDPRIVQLASSLASLGWYLERREGEVEALTSAERTSIESRIGRSLEGRVIRLKEGIQAYVSTFMRQPELAKKNPKKMFLSAEDGGFFDRIFTNELSADRLVTAQRLAWGVDEFVGQFMTRKRRKERVADWKNDYRILLGDSLVDRHGTVLDQVIPQSAVFLSAIVFEDWVTLMGRRIEDLIQKLEASDYSILIEKLESIIELAKGDPRLAKSWPTLLKSQSFFDTCASFLKGRRTRREHKESQQQSNSALQRTRKTRR
jgi:AIPR protein